MTAAQSLHVLAEAGRYGSDHNPLILRVACDTLSNAPIPKTPYPTILVVVPYPTPSAASDASVRYVVQEAEAYEVSLASELQQHFIPLIHHKLDVGSLCDSLEHA